MSPRNLISLLLVVSLVPTANAANSCGVYLNRVTAQSNLMNSPTMANKTLGERAAALFANLPKPFLKKYRDTIFAYLYMRSGRTDSVDALVSVYQAQTGKSTSLDKATVTDLCKSKKIDKETEFKLRLNPNLHELQKLFEIPGMADDSARFETDKRQIVDELKSLDPLEKQIVIRSVLKDISDTKDANASSYAYTVLLAAAAAAIQSDASVVAKGQEKVLKYAKELAASLGLLLPPEELEYDDALAKQQLNAIIMEDVPGNKLQSFRLWLAFRNVFLKYNLSLKGGTVFTSVAFAAVGGGLRAWDWFLSSDFEPVSYYSYPNEILLTLAGVLGTKFMMQYLAVLKQGPHPLNWYSTANGTNTVHYYLKEETEKRTALTLNVLKTQIAIVTGVLMRPMVAAPLPTVPVDVAAPETPSPAEPATAAVADPVTAQTKTTDAPTPSKAQGAKNSGSVTTVVTADEIQDRVNQAKTPAAFTPTVIDGLRDSAKRFTAFFSQVKSRVAERDHYTDLIATALLMPKAANIQILSEPGVGKTAVNKFMLSNIKENDGNTSFFEIQMGKDTTIDDMMGTVKPSEIKNDRIVRAVENGAPGKRIGLFDEYYRAPMYTREALLEFMANGSVSLAGITYLSKSILNIFASNKYPNQVFLRDGKDAKAEMDRMLFTIILPPIFEFDDHMIELEDIDGANMPAISFDDIDNLKDFAKKVPLDRYFHSKIKILVNRMRDRVMKQEHESEVDWQRRVQAGEILMTSPEYNFRVLSPRSEAVAKKLLTRFAVFDWIQAGMPANSAPRVSEKNFQQLEHFFLENSSPTEHLNRVMKQYSEGSAEYQQFKLIINSRTEYKKTIDKIEEDLSHADELIALQRFALQIGVNWEALNGSVAVGAPLAKVTSTNAQAVDEFLKWRAALAASMAARGLIVEVTIKDLAQDKALYLANRLLNELKIP